MMLSSKSSNSSDDDNNANKLIRLLQIFSARLILEVVGGAGAIWGFSEAVGLRDQSTVWFWRPCALTVGVVFFCRWVGQVQDYLMEENLQLTKLFGEKRDEGVDGEEEHFALAPQNEKVYT